LDLDLSFNSGIAFGLGRGGGAVLVLAALALVVVVAGLGRTAMATALGTVALGLVVGGAAGNLIDRTIRDQPGVIDFIDFGWWPVFNVADSAISAGVILLLLSGRQPAKVPAPR
jgi:signal peptidase II